MQKGGLCVKNEIDDDSKLNMENTEEKREEKEN